MSWLAGGVFVWWLFPHLFWVSSQGLMLTALLLGAIAGVLAVSLAWLLRRSGYTGSGAAAARWLLPGAFVLALLALLAWGWLGQGASGPSSATLLTEQDTGRTVELQANTEFDIVLAGRPSDGYAWEWTEANWDVVGGGAWQFKCAWDGGGQTWFHGWANSPGRSPVRIVYRLGPLAPPVKTFQVELLVR
jgi:predicted secreted protein